MTTELVERVLGLSAEERTRLYAALPGEARLTLAALLKARIENPWTKYIDDPVAFVEEGLGESIWSKQVEIMRSVQHHKRTAVPACHAPGKSHLAARIVCWWVSKYPPGTARVVTTASTYRQVRGVLWPNIRRVAKRYDLPGEIGMVEWKLDGEIVADGFSPADNDETATQGVHSPNLLVLVDEAGGLSHTLGRALEALMTGGNTRLLVLGNPPVDIEGGWFEKCCNSPLYNVITIGAHDTPNFTGEDAGTCLACPPEVPPHGVATHLVDETWVNDVVHEFGEDSAFVEARVHARFPRSSATKAIPLSWVESALENEHPTPGNHIRLGIDVAADGGDEFVIAEADGFTARVVHRSSGESNSNIVDVASKALAAIQAAEQTHRDRGITEKVRVKIDAIGVGWGVAGLLETWGKEGKHASTIVAVNVSERASDPEKFFNQRAELWWNGRTLLQPMPKPEGLRQELRLDLPDDRRTVAQMAGPQYKADSSGRIQIESKKEMKRRGVPSPDRAEAILLALYEPPGRAPLPEVAPISMGQSNVWSL